MCTVLPARFVPTRFPPLGRKRIGINRLAALLLFITACLAGKRAVHAADTLRTIASRPMSARAVATDELGNVYAIQTDNTLARYNERGDSTGFYRTTLNGMIGTVDATNPLRLLLYYPAFNKVQLLDRQLALKAEIDLHPLGILSQTAVATASDGNLWVYDLIAARLLKLDERGIQISESMDLRQQLPFVPRASSLVERDRRLYLCDTAHGILVFDQFATYITLLPFPGVMTVQAFDQQLVFARGDTLHRYNMQTFEEKRVPLPNPEDGIVDVSLSQKALVILYSRWLALYKAFGAGQ